MKLRLTTYILLFMFSSGIFCQSNFIDSVQLISTNDILTIQPKLNNFIDDEILDAVNSGMKVTFHFYTELFDAKKNQIDNQENLIQVRNDIWENQYTISGYKFLKKFKEFENFKKFLLDSIQFEMPTKTKIDLNKQLQLIMTFSPQKISTSQKERIRSWLKNEDNDSESTLSLNLSKLISFFMSDEKKENFSVYKSEIFTIKSVKSNEKIMVHSGRGEYRCGIDTK